MYSALGRIGIILPSNNTVLEPEAYRVLPKGVTAHFARYLTGKEKFDLTGLRSREGFAEAAEALAIARVDLVVLACMASTISRGREWERGEVREIASICKVPVITAYSATREALEHLGRKSLSVGTPYPLEMHALVRPFLESDGLTVQKDKNLGLTGLQEVCRMPAQAAFDLARAVDSPSSDVICLMATDFPTLTIIERAELQLKKPVVSTNQAILWKSLNILGVGKGRKGFGRLLANI